MLMKAAPSVPTCLPISEFAGGWAATSAPAISVAMMAPSFSIRSMVRAAPG